MLLRLLAAFADGFPVQAAFLAAVWQRLQAFSLRLWTRSPWARGAGWLAGKIDKLPFGPHVRRLLLRLLGLVLLAYACTTPLPAFVLGDWLQLRAGTHWWWGAWGVAALGGGWWIACGWTGAWPLRLFAACACAALWTCLIFGSLWASGWWGFQLVLHSGENIHWIRSHWLTRQPMAWTPVGVFALHILIWLAVVLRIAATGAALRPVLVRLGGLPFVALWHALPLALVLGGGFVFLSIPPDEVLERTAHWWSVVADRGLAFSGLDPVFGGAPPPPWAYAVSGAFALLLGWELLGLAAALAARLLALPTRWLASFTTPDPITGEEAAPFQARMRRVRGLAQQNLDLQARRLAEDAQHRARLARSLRERAFALAPAAHGIDTESALAYGAEITDEIDQQAAQPAEQDPGIVADLTGGAVEPEAQVQLVEQEQVLADADEPSMLDFDAAQDPATEGLPELDPGIVDGSGASTSWADSLGQFDDPEDAPPASPGAEQAADSGPGADDPGVQLAKSLAAARSGGATAEERTRAAEQAALKRQQRLEAESAAADAEEDELDALFEQHDRQRLDAKVSAQGEQEVLSQLESQKPEERGSEDSADVVVLDMEEPDDEDDDLPPADAAGQPAPEDEPASPADGEGDPPPGSPEPQDGSSSSGSGDLAAAGDGFQEPELADPLAQDAALPGPSAGGLSRSLPAATVPDAGHVAPARPLPGLSPTPAAASLDAPAAESPFAPPAPSGTAVVSGAAPLAPPSGTAQIPLWHSPDAVLLAIEAACGDYCYVYSSRGASDIVTGVIDVIADAAVAYDFSSLSEQSMSVRSRFCQLNAMIEMGLFASAVSREAFVERLRERLRSTRRDYFVRVEQAIGSLERSTTESARRTARSCAGFLREVRATT